jgi:hypothetical protein
MNTNKYQVWEGEMEAVELEENGVSFLAAIFSAMLGILLFFVLIAKTTLMSAFGLKSGSRRKITSLKSSELNMSVS